MANTTATESVSRVTGAAELIIPTTGTLPLLLTVRQASEVLGLGRGTVYKLINTGILRARKIGRATRITTESVLREAGYRK